MFTYYDKVNEEYHFIDQSNLDVVSTLKTDGELGAYIKISGDSRHYYGFTESENLITNETPGVIESRKLFSIS